MAEQRGATWSRNVEDGHLDQALRHLLEIAERDADDHGHHGESEPVHDLVLEELLEIIMTRSLEGLRIDEVYVETTHFSPRTRGEPRRVLVTATGLDPSGDPEPLDFLRGEDVAASTLTSALLVRLRERGLQGVRRVLSSAGTSLADVVPAVFPGAGWLPLGRGERPDWLTLPDA